MYEQSSFWAKVSFEILCVSTLKKREKLLIS